jgi:G3E family GTPase
VADDIIVTKCDLLPGGGDGIPPALASMLRRLNPAARLHDAATVTPRLHELMLESMPDPSVDVSQAEHWLNLAAYAPNGAPHSDDGGHGVDDGHDGHDHGSHLDDVASFCYVNDAPMPREALHLLLRALEDNLGPNLLRVKGLVNIAEEPGKPAVLHGAQHLLHNVVQLDAWPGTDRRTRIVFIAQGVARQTVAEMIELLARVATRTANARSRASSRA